MLLSNSKQFIFIHIFKTAGTSVMDVFLPYARIIDRLVYDYQISRKLLAIFVSIMGWSDDGNIQITGFHKHATSLEIREKLGEDKYNDFYKFCFVRNPFDWLVSLYFYIRQSSGHRLYRIAQNMDFNEFIKYQIETNLLRQYNFIIDQEHKIIVDYIGRYESIENDLDLICKKLAIPFAGLKHKNKSIGRKNKNYKYFYNDTSISLVSNYFKEDLDLLGYCFDGIIEKNSSGFK